MRHCRTDYEAIQPWPTKRPHFVKRKTDGVLVEIDPAGRGLGEDLYDPIIPEDEPVFLIRAMDKVGPAIVNRWASLAEQNGADPALVARVREFAIEMKAYADAHGGGEIPDTPEGMLKP